MLCDSLTFAALFEIGFLCGLKYFAPCLYLGIAYSLVADDESNLYVVSDAAIIQSPAKPVLWQVRH